MMRTTRWRARCTRRPGAWKMPRRSAASGVSPASVETQQLEPPHEVGRHGNGHQPVGVGLEAGEREAHEPRVLQPLDVGLDVGVGPHGDVEFPWGTVLVGVEAPVPVVEAQNRLRWAPGWSGSRRMISRVSEGSLFPSISEVGSATAVPSLCSPA